ncbi:MAG: TfoX/Sxy family protein [Fimbriimonas sp.]
MPVSPEKVDQFLQRLGEVRPITSRKMFGGIGLYSDGVFFAVIDNDRLYFKSDAETDPTYEAHGSAQWVIEGDPPSPMPYREVPASVFAGPDLGAWIDAAVAVATRKKSAPKRARPKT